MKNIIKTIIGVVAISFSIQAHALLISEVGGVDTFLTSASLSNSGDATEEAWVEGYLGFDVSLDDKYDSEGPDWTLASDAGNTNVYYRALSTSAEYFLLKLGNGGTTMNSHFLFRNIGDLGYAVVDFLEAGIDFSVRKINIGRMSHVGEFESTQVPEPSSLFLLGLGLIALGAQRRRTK